MLHACVGMRETRGNRPSCPRKRGAWHPFVRIINRNYLSVVELRNFLIGDDFAVFEISTTRPDETLEIEQLLQTIATSGVVFIRNGNRASGSEAATHLRNKWRNATPRITTVQGFIERIASRSSLTGKPYQVKLADDSVLDAGSWLRERPRDIGEQPEP